MAMNWIKVEDQVPEFGLEVLTYVRWREYDMYNISKLISTTTSADGIGYEWVDERYNAIEVTHWAKLTPPKS